MKLTLTEQLEARDMKLNAIFKAIDSLDQHQDIFKFKEEIRSIKATKFLPD